MKNKRPVNKIIPWPDLSAYGFGLRVITTGLGQRVICPVLKSSKTGKYMPFTGKNHHHALTQCGFRLTNGIYWKDAGAFSLSVFQKPFPKVKRIEIGTASLMVNKPSWASKIWKIGRNNRDEDVFLDFNTRRGVQTDSGMHIEAQSTMDSRFLRAFDHSSNKLDDTMLAHCCDGFVNELRHRKMTRNDMIMFASAVAGRNVSTSDLVLRDIQDAIEASMHRSIRAYAKQTDVQFDFARRLYENQPVLDARTSESIRLQQFSTPAPMASVVGQIVNTLKPSPDKHVFEPCVGTGSLLAPINGVRSATGIELDDMRARYVRGLSDAINVIHGDATNIELVNAVDKADVIVANPPFGRTAKKIINETAIQRIDYEIAMRSLDRMKDDGVAVLIVAADSVITKQAGMIKGGSRYFLNYLHSHYNVKDIIEMSGSLFSSQGAGFPTRMIVVDGRKSEPDDQLAPKTVSVIHDYDALWAWQGELLQGAQANVADIADDDVEVESAGDYQAKYHPASKLESAREALIPKNMASYVFEALNTLDQEYGNVDEYVASELEMSEDEFKSSFSAAQVDAIALSINAMKNDNGMIIGDQTGFGKGRIMAGLARYGILQGKTPIFVTGKANLFSDITRDFNDIHSGDMIKPLIINSDASSNILDKNGDVVTRSASQNKDRASFIKNKGKLPEQYNTVFLTYSQVNRLRNPKALALQNLSMDNGMVLLDEAHNAAGESNIHNNIRGMIQSKDKHVPVVYASATAIKTHKNLDIYMHSMNLPYSTLEIVEAAERGGESFLQIFTTMMAKEGLIIRREYSMDDVKFSQHKPSRGSLLRNHQIANAIPDILGRMAVLAGEIKNHTAIRADEIKQVLSAMPEAARKGSRMGIRYLGFGSSLHNLNRQMMMAMRAGEMSISVLEDIKAGKKPVIALQNTMDSLVAHVLENVEPDENGNYILDKKINIADALLKSLESLMSYTETNHQGIKTKIRMEDAEVVAFYEEAKKSIQDEPLLNSIPITIFDELAHTIEAEGHKVSEVSGRKWTYEELENGKICYHLRGKVDRNKEIFNFNNGEADVILLSGSGSTGLSLHASETFKDQRARVMHIAQADQNISEFIQMLGRVNRNGQVCSPEIKFHTTGIVGEKRELGALISKLGSLMASSTANRESCINTLVDNTIDIVNKVGDEAVIEVLCSDERIAQRMDINLDKYIDGGDVLDDVEDGALARKFMGSLSLLKPGQIDEDMLDMNNPSEDDVLSQLYVYKSVMKAFDAQVLELEARGINPFRVNHHDWNATTLRRQLYSGDDSISEANAFHSPCFIEEVEYTCVSKPLKMSKILEYVEHGTTRFSENMATNYPDVTPLQALKSMHKDILKDYASPFDVEKISDDELDAIMNNEANEFGLINRMDSNIKLILEMLRKVRVGAIFDINLNGIKERAIVTNFRIPKPHELHRMSSYGFSLAIEGREKLTTCSGVTIVGFMDDKSSKWGCTIKELVDAKAYVYKKQLAKITESFDTYPEGEHQERRVLLTGNMIEASMRNSGCLTTYTNDKGQRKTAYILPSAAKFDAVVRSGIKERRPDVIETLLRSSSVSALSNMQDYNSTLGISINSVKDHFRLTVPGTKKNGGIYHQNRDLLELLGELSGSRHSMGVDIPSNKLNAALKIIIPLCKGIHLSGANLEMSRNIGKKDVNSPVMSH